MKYHKIVGPILVAMAVLLVLATTVLSQTGGSYDLTWWTLDSGGGKRTGENYELVGTIGQADTGVFRGGFYTIIGGFWANVDPNPPDLINLVYLPVVIK